MIMIVVLVAPSAARGDAGQFIPTFYGFEGELDFGMAEERIKNTTRGKGIETSDTYFAEKIVLSTTGFVYHPRFLVFFAKLGGGLSQENFETSNPAANSGGGSWRNNPLWEYELRTILLPEHPYNLELFALRLNPYIPGRTGWGIQSVNLSQGALFSYRGRPWTFRLGYTNNTIENEQSTTDTRTITTGGGYSLENFSLFGAYSHSDTHGNPFGRVGTEFTSENYSLQNQLRFFDRKFFLTSEVGRNILDSDTGGRSQASDRFTWTEQLKMYLPRNFEALLTYNHYKDTEKSLEEFSDAEVNFTTTTDTAGFTISNRLYESLYTAYTFNYSSLKSPTGDMKDTTNSLNATYTKRIPRGRLTAGGFLSKTFSDRNGAPTVTNEVHNAGIFGEFPLARTDIDETSVRISVRDPGTGAFVDLSRDTHYLFIRVGNSLAIKIIAIPAEALSPDPLFVYEFHVTYLFSSGSSELETSDVGYSLKLELLEGFINPYYNYSHRSQEVLSGSIPWVPDDSTTRTAGVTLKRPPYSLLLEHQDVKSTNNPSKRDRVEGTFRQDVTGTTNLNLHAYYVRVENLEGLSTPTRSTETGTGGDIMIQRRFPPRNLTLNVLGSYSQRKSVFNTTMYSLNAGLTWTQDKLDLTLGANVSDSETTLDTGKQESLHQRYYLLVRRKLF